MSLPPAPEITRLLQAWRAGDDGALDQLTPLVYGELRRLAHARMRHAEPGHTLQTTALANEAFIRLVDARRVDWQDRAHFFAICARVMRHILVDAARTRRAQKRGGGAQFVAFDDQLAMSPARDPDLLALDEALTQLSREDPRQGQVVELRYFGGLSVEETAEVLKVSPQTVLRDWKLAKLWLVRALRHAGESHAEAGQ
jgi:RNA polymerase sigma factor (TIGR02999 family)